MKNLLLLFSVFCFLSCFPLKNNKNDRGEIIYPILLDYISIDKNLLEFIKNNQIHIKEGVLQFDISKEKIPIHWYSFYNEISLSALNILKGENKEIALMDSLSRMEEKSKCRIKNTNNKIKHRNINSNSPLIVFFSCIEDNFVSAEVYIKRGRHKQFQQIALMNGGQTFLFELTEQNKIKNIYKSMYSID